MIQRLFDARVIHFVKRGYADKDNPGVRYNIYTLDYGTYVDLLKQLKNPTVICHWMRICLQGILLCHLMTNEVLEGLF